MFRKLEFILQAVRASEEFRSDLHFRKIFVVGGVEYKWRKLSKETVGYWDSLDEKRIVTWIGDSLDENSDLNSSCADREEITFLRYLRGYLEDRSDSVSVKKMEN